MYFLKTVVTYLQNPDVTNNLDLYLVDLKNNVPYNLDSINNPDYYMIIDYSRLGIILKIQIIRIIWKLI